MSDERDEGPDRGFKVQDRRRFEPDGSERSSEEPGPDTGSAGAPAGATEGRQLPEIDFSTFVLSLATSAIVHLGGAPRPDGTTQKDLTLAKQTIDLLALLKTKTAGNLTEEEATLLDECLYDLRMRFVAAAQQA